MSLSAMAERAATANGARDGARTTTGTAGPELAKAVAAVAAYFPTETVGTYLAVLAILQPGSAGERWAFYFVFLAFTAVVVLYYSWRRQEASGQMMEGRTLAWLFVFSGVSFTLWSATTPWTPFLEFTDDAQRFAGAAIIVLSPLLPMAAQVLRLSPPWREGDTAND